MIFGAIAFALLLDVAPAPAAAPSPAVPVSNARDAEVRARVAQWWVAREKRYQRTMYDLYHAEYRKNVGFQEHVAQAVQRDKYDVVGHVIRDVTYETASRARILVDCSFHVPQFGREVTTAVTDTWVLEKGKWFKVPPSGRVQFATPSPVGPRQGPAAPPSPPPGK
jgi:hypothetical protein